MNNKFELIVCIVNHGFADEVIKYARECGAKGGTVVNARGTAKAEAEKMFNIAIQPEKEVLLIVVEKELKDDILKTIYDHVGLNSAGQGIAFSIPVDDAVGMAKSNKLLK